MEQNEDNAQGQTRKYASLVILIFINLLNFMDRFAVAAVLPDIQNYYNISDKEGGVLQSAFIVVFMICSPICGYLGDRYNRKHIIVGGIGMWLLAVLSSTFVPRKFFAVFVVTRGLVGIGEASYATVTPSIIGDIFGPQQRATMLMFFYFAIPVGCGLGFVIGALMTSLLGTWQWALRVDFGLGCVCLLLIILVIKEPKRGGLEQSEEKGQKGGSYIADVLALLKNKTYIFSTMGYTSVLLAAGTLSWWIPVAIQRRNAFKHGFNSTEDLSDDDKTSSSTLFGIITVVGGLFGVTIGSKMSQLFRNGCGSFKGLKNSRSDALVSAIGALIGLPTMFITFRIMENHVELMWIVLSFCITALCFNWAIVIDLLMSVVIPSRRNAAVSWEMLISHALGDASGPFVVGWISDSIRAHDPNPDLPRVQFHALLKAFYLPNAVLVIGVILFLISFWTCNGDIRKFNEEMGIQEESSETAKESKLEKNTSSTCIVAGTPTKSSNTLVVAGTPTKSNNTLVIAGTPTTSNNTLVVAATPVKSQTSITPLTPVKVSRKKIKVKS